LTIMTFFFSSRRRHTRSKRDWSSDVCASDLNYALSLLMEEKESALTEIDSDLICNTIQGRPIKPKTLGQKNYVDQIRKNMIVFRSEERRVGKECRTRTCRAHAREKARSEQTE